MTGQHRSYRTFILLIGLIACLFVLSRQLIWLSRQPAIASSADFMEYWAAGRLNIQGGNPYSASDLQIIQQQSEPIIMWSFDQVVLLLPIIWCAVGLLNGGTRQDRCIAVLFFLVVNGMMYYLRFQQATEFLYLWLAPTLLLGYLGVRRQLATSERLS